MADLKQVMSWLEWLTFDDWQRYHSDSEVQTIAKEALELLKDYKELKERHKQLLEAANNLDLALQEKEKIIDKYHRADGFLAVHGWKWEDADGGSGEGYQRD